MFCGGDKNRDRHRGEYLEKGNIFCGGEANHRKKKKDNIWRKIRFCQWRRGDTVREYDEIKMS